MACLPFKRSSWIEEMLSGEFKQRKGAVPARWDEEILTARRRQEALQPIIFGI